MNPCWSLLTWQEKEEVDMGLVCIEVWIALVNVVRWGMTCLDQIWGHKVGWVGR